MPDNRECCYICANYVEKVYRLGDAILGRVFVCYNCREKIEKESKNEL